MYLVRLQKCACLFELPLCGFIEPPLCEIFARLILPSLVGNVWCVCSKLFPQYIPEETAPTKAVYPPPLQDYETNAPPSLKK